MNKLRKKIADKVLQNGGELEWKHLPRKLQNSLMAEIRKAFSFINPKEDK